LLYMNFLELVMNPKPRGAFKPKDCLTIRFHEVRAAILFLNEGLLNPNLILVIKE